MCRNENINDMLLFSKNHYFRCYEITEEEMVFPPR